MVPYVYTGVSLLVSSLTASSFSAVVCCFVVGYTGSYSPGFISQSGREPVSNPASMSVSASPVCLLVCTHVVKVSYFTCRH